MKFPIKDPMIVFARVKGPNGFTRELKSVLDFNSPYCLIFGKDALGVGFPEAVIRPRDWQKTHPDKVVYVLDFRGIERTVLMKMPEISLGKLEVADVETAVLQVPLPHTLPFDLILGRSFLQNFKVTIDSAKGYISLV
jgi:hypothetical protein